MVSDEKFVSGSQEAHDCALQFMIFSAVIYFKMRDGYAFLEEDVLNIIRDAEEEGIVSEEGMRNSGMMKNGMGMAVDHLLKRTTRAFNIAKNPKGYTAPSKPLYDRAVSPQANTLT